MTEKFISGTLIGIKDSRSTNWRRWRFPTRNGGDAWNN